MPRLSISHKLSFVIIGSMLITGCMLQAGNTYSSYNYNQSTKGNSPTNSDHMHITKSQSQLDLELLQALAELNAEENRSNQPDTQPIKPPRIEISIAPGQENTSYVDLALTGESHPLPIPITADARAFKPEKDSQSPCSCSFEASPETTQHTHGKSTTDNNKNYSDDDEEYFTEPRIQSMTTEKTLAYETDETNLWYERSIEPYKPSLSIEITIKQEPDQTPYSSPQNTRAHSANAIPKPSYELVDDKGRTELHCAVIWNDRARVFQLLFAGANRLAQDKQGSTALIHAAFRGYASIIKLLLRKDGKKLPSSESGVNLCDHAGSSALKLACQQGHTAIVELLLQSGAQIDLPDNHGKTPYMYAQEKGFTDILSLLAQHVAQDKLAANHNTYNQPQMALRGSLENLPNAAFFNNILNLFPSFNV